MTRSEPTDSATYKFREPCDTFQSGESFWTSLFALLLLSSEGSARIDLPVWRPMDGHHWFVPRPEPWSVPAIEGGSLVVEGKNGLADFATMVSGAHGLDAHTRGLAGLFPDIAVWDGRELKLVEVKTIGANLTGDQVSKYLIWATALSAGGCPSRAMFLLSKGHENVGNHRWLVNAADEPRFGGVLLWEDVFLVMREMAAAGAPLPSMLRSAGLLELSPEGS